MLPEELMALEAEPYFKWLTVTCFSKALKQCIYINGKKIEIYIYFFYFFLQGVQVFLHLKYIPTSRYYFWASYFALNSKIKHTGSQTITLGFFSVLDTG